MGRVVGKADGKTASRHLQYKVTEEATLSWPELSKVVLDIETQIKRRPLNHVDGDIELPTCTSFSKTFFYQAISQQSKVETRCISRWTSKGEKNSRGKDGLWRRSHRKHHTTFRQRQMKETRRLSNLVK